MLTDTLADMLVNKKRLLVAFTASALFVGSAWANEGGAHLETANNDVTNTASLQRGARNFVNYCYGCHSAQYVRFNRVAADLGLTEDQVINNLMFTGERPSDLMKNAMPTTDSARWFGRTPPDLSLIARAKGTDHIYTFLKSFYLDPSRPTGMNNTVLPSAAMPNVLWELQGLQRKVEVGKANEHGDIEKKTTGFESVTKGKLSEDEFDQFVRDTVNFLDYIGEPMQVQRRKLGSSVLLFLLIFFGFAYYLKQEYWKDVK
jgi:ubiquinol-cytochrome c reductase cytochrome c1 subunit